MADDKTDIVIGTLLHDIGKLAYRGGDARAHGASGRDLLAGIESFADSAGVLECVAYHHGKELAGAGLPASSPAYITRLADNIASGADISGLGIEGADGGFDATAPLGSVFNIINGNDDSLRYAATTPGRGGLSFPSADARPYDASYYNELLRGVTEGLRGIKCSREYVNPLLDLLEGYLSSVPASTSARGRTDISLYDHSKTAAAVGSCVYAYLSARGASDYKAALYDGADAFYGERCFLLYSCDMSGIQEFLYTVSGDKALKSLRARSFYLEIMLEHIADELLESLGLSRVNLIYTGGGHAYMLLPNTNEVKAVLRDTERGLNKWFLDNFKTALYIACAYEECSGNDLMNRPDGSYPAIYAGVSAAVSAKKLNRYGAEAIRGLNGGGDAQNERECRECKRADTLTEEDICSVCDALQKMSSGLTRDNYFVITTRESDGALILPGGKYLVLTGEYELCAMRDGPGGLVRFYRKNAVSSGLIGATNLWMGDYTCQKTFAEMADASEGISRIAVLRADVDNLGHAFVSGFRNHARYGDEFLTISRTATLSHRLSMFFKYHVNEILTNPRLRLKTDTGKPRNAVIVYSGGDDMFIVGGWNDCVELAVDIHDAFEKYTQGTLTISAGLCMFERSYPLARVAQEAGRLESAAKEYDDVKSKIALFESDGVYGWAALKNAIIGEKLRVLQEFFKDADAYGTAMIYKLLEYLRAADDKINLARLAYMLAKLRPNDADAAEQERYNAFSKRIYGWALDKMARRELETALTLYVYSEREKGDQ
jgi:CRISPR-associated protein Csm1